MNGHLVLFAMVLLGQAAPPAPRAWYIELLPLFTALIAVGATLLGLFIGPQLNRRVAKKGPKTEMRARAYEDFVAYYLRPEPPAAGAGVHGRDLNDILARLLVFGESEVISAVAAFLNNPEKCDLADVIVKMRASVLTGQAEELIIKVLNKHAPHMVRQRS